MVDARGLSCPMPVVMVQNEVKKGNPDHLTVMVDAMVCVENVKRYASSQGYRVDVTEVDGEYKLELTK